MEASVRSALGLLFVWLLAVTPAAAQHAGHAPEPVAENGTRTPTVAVAADGTLWRVWVEGEHVLVSRSGDRGASYAAPVRVTREPEPIDANGESRPKIALGPSGDVYVSYTRLGRLPYTGDIRFARSVDGGRTFDAPRTVNDDGLETGHRFDALTVGPDGALYLVWIDKRDLDRAEAQSEAYDGAALYLAVSRDRGATFAANRKIKDHICECCRIAHAFDAQGRLVLAWRDVMPGSIRDHAMVRVSADGAVTGVQRLTTDGWVLDGCPHHGPALAMGVAGRMHLAWFTGEGPQGPGAFYAMLDSGGRIVGTPRRLGAPDAGTGHAAIHAAGRDVVVAWKERRGTGSAVVVMVSRDGGDTFDTPHDVAEASRASDHPALVPTPSGLLLSWFAPETGHRLIPISLGTNVTDVRESRRHEAPLP